MAESTKTANHGRNTWGHLALLAALTLTTAATAAPVVDGRFDPNEGYTTGYSVDFDVEGGHTATGGELWLHQDGATGDVYVSFTQPKTLVDNTYGDNSIGWGSDAASGKRHNFGGLLCKVHVGEDDILGYKTRWLVRSLTQSRAWCEPGRQGGGSSMWSPAQAKWEI